VEVRTQRLGPDTRTEYITPVGTVSTRQRHSELLERGGIDTQTDVAHMIKEPDDYPVVEYIIQHTDIIPTYGTYLAYEREIGEDGVPLVGIGPDPMYHILQDLIGYSQAFFHLHDYPVRVHHLLAVLTEYAEAVQEVVLASPAKLILHGEHFSSQFTPPNLFKTYMLPYFQAFADKLHARHKVLACHADADTSRLLPLIKEAGFDMAECFVTAPMVPVTLEEARQAFGEDVIIWGGIPSVMLGPPISDQEFRAYVRDLFSTIAPGDAFILGVADNVMAEANLERLVWVSTVVAEYGTYPIQDPLPL
jgi:uroporphyrinogen-III decarboxylase